MLETISGLLKSFGAPDWLACGFAVFIQWVLGIAILGMVGIVLVFFFKHLAALFLHLLGFKESSAPRLSVFSYIILIALVITFGGFAYMHYNTISRPPYLSLSPTKIEGEINSTINAPKKLSEDNQTIALLQTMLENNERATNRIIAICTVFVTATMFVSAIQFMRNEKEFKSFQRDCTEIKKRKMKYTS